MTRPTHITRTHLILAFGLLLAGLPQPATSQVIVPWFNGIGASAGGGPLRFRGNAVDPTTALVRPDDERTGAIAVSVYVSFGTRRWALLLPQFDALGGYGRAGQLSGTLTRDGTTVTIAPTDEFTSVYTVQFAGQFGLVPSGRVWVRGGAGTGWLSGGITTEDQRLSVAIDGGSGLALSAAGGVSVWTRQFDERRLSVDAEVHYLRLGANGLRATSPSARIGVRWSP